MEPVLACNDGAQGLTRSTFPAMVIFKPSSIHGVGAFAGMDLVAGVRVIEYVGEQITKQESLARCERNNDYIFAIDNEHDLDGSVDWNPARFLNHSCAPNCEALFEEGRIWIKSTRAIRAGEELTFNYGYDLEDYREHPCHCGADSCVGFIVAEEFLEHVRRMVVIKEEPPVKHGMKQY